MNNVFVVFIFLMGMIFKIIDDIYDNTSKFPQAMIDNIDIFQYILIVGMTLIVNYEPKITYLLLFTTIACLMSDNIYNLKNIDTRYWTICSLVVLIYAVYYWKILVTSIFDFFSLKTCVLIVMMTLFSGIEMTLFDKEYSLLKILVRFGIASYMGLFLIIKKLYSIKNVDMAIVILILFKMGYMVASVIHMCAFYAADFKAFHEPEEQLIRLILELKHMPLSPLVL